MIDNRLVSQLPGPNSDHAAGILGWLFSNGGDLAAVPQAGREMRTERDRCEAKRDATLARPLRFPYSRPITSVMPCSSDPWARRGRYAEEEQDEDRWGGR